MPKKRQTTSSILGNKGKLYDILKILEIEESAARSLA